MSTVVWTDRIELSSFADDALMGATRFFFAVAFAGRLLFALTIAAHYVMATARGSLQTFNKHLTHGWQRGDAMGNLAIAPAPAPLATACGGGSRSSSSWLASGCHWRTAGKRTSSSPRGRGTG